VPDLDVKILEPVVTKVKVFNRAALGADFNWPGPRNTLENLLPAIRRNDSVKVPVNYKKLYVSRKLFVQTSEIQSV
jgi:hypothetical protein